MIHPQNKITTSNTESYESRSLHFLSRWPRPKSENAQNVLSGVERTGPPRWRPGPCLSDPVPVLAPLTHQASSRNTVTPN